MWLWLKDSLVWRYPHNIDIWLVLQVWYPWVVSFIPLLMLIINTMHSPFTKPVHHSYTPNIGYGFTWWFWVCLLTFQKQNMSNLCSRISSDGEDQVPTSYVHMKRTCALYVVGKVVRAHPKSMTCKPTHVEYGSPRTHNICMWRPGH
jgi:hypothetical protein